MDFFLLFLGIVFMGLGFVVPFVIDCGIGSIGLFILGLIGLYFFVTNILDAFGEPGKALHASIDEKISTVFSVLSHCNAAESVYYDISVIGYILVGGFFTLWTLGLGWVTFSLFKSFYIGEALTVGVLFLSTIPVGPVRLYKGIKEFFGRVHRLIQQNNEADIECVSENEEENGEDI